MKIQLSLLRFVSALAFLMSINAAFAGSSFGIKVDDPTFCLGQNELGQCVTYFGDAEACKSLEPCSQRQHEKFITPVINRSLTWCYGMNDLDECKLFVGTKESCANVSPCSFNIELLQTKSY